MSIKTGITGTTENLFTIGNSIDGYKYIYADISTSAIKPGLRWNDTDTQWEFSNDGYVWIPFGEGSIPDSTDQYTILQGGIAGDWVESSNLMFPYGANRTISMETGETGFDLTVSGTTTTGINDGGDVFIVGGGTGINGTQGGTVYVDSGPSDDGDYGGVSIASQTPAVTVNVKFGDTGSASVADVDFTSSGNAYIISDFRFDGVTGGDKSIYVDVGGTEDDGLDLTIYAGTGGPGGATDGGNTFVRAGVADGGIDGNLYLGDTQTLNIGILGSPGGGNWQTGTGIIFIEETAASPSAAPTATGGFFYAKDDGYLYWRSDLGEFNLTMSSDPSLTSNHNELTGLQGGGFDAYYHLEEDEWNFVNDGYTNGWIESQGGTGETIYSQGDLLIGDSGTGLEILPIGSDGYNLIVSGSTAVWEEGYYHVLHVGKIGTLLTDTDGYLLTNLVIAPDQTFPAFVVPIKTYAGIMRVDLGTAPGLGESVTITFRVESTDTIKVITLSGAETSGEDITPINIAEGNSLHVRVETSSSSAAEDITVSVMLYPSHFGA